MWSDVLKKIETLKKYDRRFTVLYSSMHRYEFRAPASAQAVREAEARLGVPLPAELKFIYLELGNGGVGPDEGLRPVEAIKGYNPGREFRGFEYYNDPENELSSDTMCGLIAIMDRYYAHESCVVCYGMKPGSVVGFSAGMGFVIGEGDSIEDCYNRWLDPAIANFEGLRTKIFAGQNLRTILSASAEPLAVLRMLASLCNLGLTHHIAMLFTSRIGGEVMWPARVFFGWHMWRYRVREERRAL
jgi:hypothetical protein